MGPDDAESQRDDRDDDPIPPLRHVFSFDFGDLGGWLFLIVLSLLVFRCNGVSLW